MKFLTTIQSNTYTVLRLGIKEKNIFEDSYKKISKNRSQTFLALKLLLGSLFFVVLFLASLQPWLISAGVWVFHYGCVDYLSWVGFPSRVGSLSYRAYGAIPVLLLQFCWPWAIKKRSFFYLVVSICVLPWCRHMTAAACNF